MEVKKIPKEDIYKVVKVHKTSFKGFFLTDLGNHFLKVYYDCVRKDPRGVLLGFYENQELCGFAAATLMSKGFNKHLVGANLFQFSIISIRLLFTRIPALIRLYNNFTKTNSTVDDTGEYAELLSIGVSEKKQGQGIGKKLLTALENEIIGKVSRLSLTTDYYHNEKTINFYNGLGYTIYYDFVAYPNRKMYRMIKNLKQ
jgi:ribosomal protein S18 acetylase RimI-like enzyme